MTVLRKLLVGAVMIVALVGLNVVPASAHDTWRTDHYIYTGHNCELDHYVGYNLFGSGVTGSVTQNTNCWSTYTRVYAWWDPNTSYWENPGNPNSTTSISGHQASGFHLACFGLYNCNGLWYGFSV